MLRRYRSGALMAAASALLVLAAAQPAQAQTEWRQTFQVITPIEESTPVSALRDSIMDMALRKDLSMKRAPDDESMSAIGDIENTLLNQGLDFTSANRLLIRYRFHAERGELKREIEDLFFIYRPDGGAQGEDLPVMYIDLDEQEAFSNLLNNSGMTLRINEASFTPFREQLMFHKLPESQLIALGGEVIRDEAEAETERRRLLQNIQRFLY